MLRSAQGYKCVKTEVYFLIKTTDKYRYSKFSVSVAISDAKCSYWKKKHRYSHCCNTLYTVQPYVYYSSKHEKLN